MDRTLRANLLLLVTAVAISMPAATIQAASIRELDVYCIDSDGARYGVAASQDGATVAYSRSASGEDTIQRTFHSRGIVSGWHHALDTAGFSAFVITPVDGARCAIERTMDGQRQLVSWRADRGPPPALADIFASIMGVRNEGSFHR